MGVRGWMPIHTWEEMGRLGITKAARKKLYTQMSILALNSLVTCVNTRRKQETVGQQDGSNINQSGYVRYMEDKNEEKREQKEKKKHEAGYRVRQRPKKGEG
jgi:hypothetical protein